MDFARSVEYLLSLGNEVSAMKLGLENIRTLLAALGNPHEKYLKVQVAGTNGKGSVCAFLDSICNEAGICTGTYTSPHLLSMTERISINGIDISEHDFARIANIVRETAETMLSEKRLEYRPTFFEQMTAIALVAFSEANVELAILETGLGGRLDATTAAEAEIAAITRIDVDHQEYLGETIEEIATEKAAIIGPHTKAVVIGKQNEEAMKICLSRCAQYSVIPRTACKTYESAVDMSKRSVVVEFYTNRGRYWDSSLGLAGRHQIENAAVAVLIAEVLALDFHLHISEEHIWNGLEEAKNPGRLEYVGRRYLLDGAHNASGAMALREFLDEFETRAITIIFGAMRGKDIHAMVSILFPKAEVLILTVPSNSRSLDIDGLISYLPSRIDNSKVISTRSVPDALEEAEERTDDNGLIVVTGSLYLVGEVKRLLQEKATVEI